MQHATPAQFLFSSLWPLSSMAGQWDSTSVFQDHCGLSKISLNPSAISHHHQSHMELITLLKGTKVETRRRQQKPVSTSSSETLRLWYRALAPHLFTATAAVHSLYMAVWLHFSCQQWVIVSTSQENARTGGDGYTDNIWHWKRLQPLLTWQHELENVRKKFSRTLKDHKLIEVKPI